MTPRSTQERERHLVRNRGALDARMHSDVGHGGAGRTGSRNGNGRRYKKSHCNHGQRRIKTKTARTESGPS